MAEMVNRLNPHTPNPLPPDIGGLGARGKYLPRIKKNGIITSVHCITQTEEPYFLT
jgi:hypothetical protein